MKFCNIDDSFCALAVSGGADSMYLSMQFLKHKPANQFVILIVDHGLRENSASEAEWVYNYLTDKGLKCQILKVEKLSAANGNLQERAREARYQLLLAYCNQHSIKNLYLAHNMNDQAESVFMNLERGSGLDGACGIAGIKRYGAVNICRPMLNTKRCDIERELIQNDWQWADDPSNYDPKFKRVEVRKYLKTYNNYDQLVERFALFSKNMQRTKDFVDQQVDAAIKDVARYDDLCFFEIDLAKFQALHEEIQLRVLTHVLSAISGNFLKPRLNKLTNLKNKIVNVSRETSVKAKDNWTLDGCNISISPGKLYIYRELSAMHRSTKSALFGLNCYDNRFEVLENAKISPLGMKGYTWLKSQLPLSKKFSYKVYLSLPTILDNEGNIVAVYGVFGNWHKYLKPVKAIV